ncbi:MAG: hypothetical protein M3R43_06035, partial [Acidobacteriota bacterium]|nr:hypothetical protein [Acidobacteriota bacterium]
MPISSRSSALLALPALALATLLIGCALQTTASPGSSQGLALTGTVHGGQPPVVGSHVHLLAAAVTGYGAASTSLLTTGTAGSDSFGGFVLTDAAGAFSITGDYTCVVGTQVYVLATQGNPGLPGNQTNPNLALMAAIGQCPATGNFVSSVPFISVNEVTTVASVYALSGYMTDLSHVASSGTPQAMTGISNAFATVNNLVDISGGGALATTPAGNGTPPQTEINTLANIIASCVNSAGASSVPCTALFANAANGSTQPTDTVTAALNIAHSPASNIANLFALQTAAAPFAPTLSAAPNDFTVAITYTGGGLDAPVSIAIDGNDNVWMVNLNTSLSEFNGITGEAISPSTGFTGGGLFVPFAIGIDPLGNAWVVNQNTTVSKFTPSGAPALGSPFSGGGLNNPPSANV